MITTTMTFEQVTHMIDMILSECPSSETAFYYYVGHEPTTEEPSWITLSAVIGLSYSDNFIPYPERDTISRILQLLDDEIEPTIKEYHIEGTDSIVNIYEFENFIVEIRGIITLY